MNSIAVNPPAPCRIPTGNKRPPAPENRPAIGELHGGGHRRLKQLRRAAHAPPSVKYTSTPPHQLPDDGTPSTARPLDTRGPRVLWLAGHCPWVLVWAGACCLLLVRRGRVCVLFIIIIITGSPIKRPVDFLVSGAGGLAGACQAMQCGRVCVYAGGSHTPSTRILSRRSSGSEMITAVCGSVTLI